MRAEPTMEIRCPKCGSGRLYRSRRRNFIERALVLVGGELRRCHECGLRYVRTGESLLRTGDLKSLSQKLYLSLTMGLALVVIMAAILWFARVQTAQGVDTGLLTLPLPYNLVLVFRQ